MHLYLCEYFFLCFEIPLILLLINTNITNTLINVKHCLNGHYGQVLCKVFSPLLQVNCAICLQEGHYHPYFIDKEMVRKLLNLLRTPQVANRKPLKAPVSASVCRWVLLLITALYICSSLWRLCRCLLCIHIPIGLTLASLWETLGKISMYPNPSDISMQWLLCPFYRESLHISIKEVITYYIVLPNFLIKFQFDWRLLCLWFYVFFGKQEDIFPFLSVTQEL